VFGISPRTYNPPAPIKANAFPADIPIMPRSVLELIRPDVWRSVLEQLPTGVYLLDSDQKIIFWNA
jgi:PAS domain-containing protein